MWEDIKLLQSTRKILALKTQQYGSMGPSDILSSLFLIPAETATLKDETLWFWCLNRTDLYSAVLPCWYFKVDSLRGRAFRINLLLRSNYIKNNKIMSWLGYARIALILI